MQHANKNKQIEKFLQLTGEVQAKLKKAWPRRETDQKVEVWNHKSMADLVEEAKELAKKHNGNWKDVRLCVDAYDDYGGGISKEITLQIPALETDEQWYARLYDINEAAGVRDEYERKEFERLKAKFNV